MAGRETKSLKLMSIEPKHSVAYALFRYQVLTQVDCSGYLEINKAVDLRVPTRFPAKRPPITSRGPSHFTDTSSFKPILIRL